MKRVVVLFPLLASALFAQWAPHRIEKSDMDVLVEFRDPPLALVRQASAKTAVAQYDAAFRKFRADLKTSLNIRHQYYELFNGVAITASQAQIDDIRKLPYVKSVQLDLPVYALAAPAPPSNVVKIRADQVWSKFGTRGAGVTVAVIDTGIDYTHPALGGCFGPGCKVIGGYDFVNNDNDPRDDNLHGTHVAGIIAGSSDQLLGVAPDVSLLAYKVLSASGSGSTSDVLAGIERAADPNNDGDFSDHADVANLSLGGLGNPDDALSTAIDRGTSLGVVYCIAAGNAGSGYHTVASPGTARTAITVGATDVNDLLASFSSRGPNTKDAALKPDVLAPGVSIISSLPGGKYGPLSGTSMATPHVAGVAALLKAVHHDWTAAQIKSAIVGTGKILGLDFMAQGGGRVDALSAASTTALVSPASISLGEDHLPQTTFSPTTTLQITNVGSQPATFTVGASPGIGITVSANPSRVKIDPGATAPVTIAYTIINGQVTPGAASLSFGNTITITSDASDTTTRVPWAAVKAARVQFTYDRPFPGVILFDPSSGSATSALPFDGANLEAFARGATYDVVLTWESVSPSTFDTTNPSIAQNDLRLHFLEGKSVTDDTTIAVNSSDATHTITFDGRNENGGAIASRDFEGYGSIGRIVFAAGSPVASLPLSAYLSRTWHVTDLNQKLITGELYYDVADSRFYVLQYPTLDGVLGDVTLTGGGADLKRVNAAFALTPPATTDQRIVILAQSIVPAGDNVNTLGLALLKQAPQFNETIFMNSTPADPTYSMATYTESITDGVVRFITPLMRIVGGQLVPTVGGGPVTPFSLNTDAFLFGNGMHFPRFNFTQSSGRLNLFTDFVGQLGEVRSGDRASTVTTVLNGNASVQASGTTYPMPLDVTAGPLTITSVDSNLLAPGIRRTSTVTSTMDATHYPPTLTAMMLFDANGKLAAGLTPHQPGSLSFAAADFSYSTTNVRTYHPIAGDKTTVSFRYSGAADWQPLTATQTGEDQNFGIAYRVDLTNVANADNVLVDMKFEIADAAGNTTSFVMAPAFAVGRDSWFGRRGPRR